MRIAIVAPLVSAIREPQRGGSQAFLSDLARGLVVRGHEVELYAASGSEVAGVRVIDTGVDPGALAATLYRASGSPAPAPTQAAEAAFAAVYAAVRERDYDVVHNHAFDAPAVELATAMRAPVRAHAAPPARRRGRRRASRAAAASDGRSDGRVRLERPGERLARESSAVDAVLPPFVPTGAIPFSRACRRRGGVRRAASAPRREPPRRSRSLGPPVSRSTCTATHTTRSTRASGSTPRRRRRGVAVHPGVSADRALGGDRAAAVVLCPALWDEPFGMVAAEAQACGTPVVAFRRGALAEVVLDGVTGFLVAPGDIAAAADGGAADAARSPARAAGDTPRAALDLESDARRPRAALPNWPVRGAVSRDRWLSGTHWLAGRVAVVTGASRGIGAATAERSQRRAQGRSLAAARRRGSRRGRGGAIRDAGGEATAVPTDVGRRRRDVERLFAAASESGLSRRSCAPPAC